MRTGAVPSGLAAISHFPGTAVPGCHIPPLRGWNVNELAPPLYPLALTHALAAGAHQDRDAS